MERESIKHGPREDEDLKHAVRSMIAGAPVEGRMRPHRLEEDTDPEVVIDPGNRPDLPDPSALDQAERDQRAELAASVASARFPARRDQLLRAAADAGADDAILTWLGLLAPTTEFANLEAVWEALGGPRETRS